jgi:hypothetical protein
MTKICKSEYAGTSVIARPLYTNVNISVTNSGELIYLLAAMGSRRHSERTGNSKSVHSYEQFV